MKNNHTFWDQKYRKGETGWDIGHISTPLQTYIDQLRDKDLKILIPGAGNSYEAEYLFSHGFTRVFIADISKIPLANFATRVPDFPKENMLHQNFFNLGSRFDLIFEQTFFCALDPSLREDYVQKMYDLLQPNGKIAGLLFDFPLSSDGPPFGGDKAEYHRLFSEKFTVEKMERAYNSIPPRAGNELFFRMKKK